MNRLVDFRIEDPADPPAERRLVPFVDGVCLLDLVADFEQRQGWSPAGGYAGLRPDRCRHQDLETACLEHYLGTPDTARRARSGTPRRPATAPTRLLDCDCGVAGCWPLEVRIDVTEHTVVWSEFSQPHRPAWRYDGLGPFSFDRVQYVESLRAVVPLMS